MKGEKIAFITEISVLISVTVRCLGSKMNVMHPPLVYGSQVIWCVTMIVLDLTKCHA